jgi:restriction endonuclease Mrr
MAVATTPLVAVAEEYALRIKKIDTDYFEES